MLTRRSLSQTQQAREILIRDGKISNVDTMYGKLGLRTNRLANLIFKLKQDGLVIESEVKQTADGEYIDCIYTLVGAEKSYD